MFSGKQALACADQTCISLEHVIFRFVSKLVMTLAHFRRHSALLHQMVNMCRGKTEDVRVFVRDILIFMMGKAFNVIIPVTDDLKNSHFKDIRYIYLFYDGKPQNYIQISRKKANETRQTRP